MAAENGGQTKTSSTQENGQQGAIQLHPSSETASDSALPTDLEVKGTITIAGVRPIAASHLAISGSFLNGRPIAASNLKVYEMLPGDRPVFYSDIHFVQDAMLPGGRPIMMSDPKLLEASMLPGNRPIAPNEVDPEPQALMGYLD